MKRKKYAIFKEVHTYNDMKVNLYITDNKLNNLKILKYTSKVFKVLCVPNSFSQSSSSFLQFVEQFLAFFKHESLTLFIVLQSIA